MTEIPLGSLSSKMYEKNGDLYYKISPIFGMQTNVFMDTPIHTIQVLEKSDQILFFKFGLSKIKMSFKPYVTGLEKVRVTKYILGFIPIGTHFGEISITNKNTLYAQMLRS